MPNDLADVIHYFLPEAGRESDPQRGPRRGRPPPPSQRGPSRLAALPVVGVPIADRDVVRAAFAWNLAVEIARLGASTAIVAPASEESAALWPATGPGPMGTEVISSSAEDLGSLYRDALDVAVDRAPEADAGLVLVRVPPLWIRKPGDGASLLRWTLLFTSADRRDLLETYGIAKLLTRTNPDAQVGVTVHGARHIREAEEAFARLSRSASERLGRDLASYGLLVDDLHVYRAIVARRPIGLAHPQSPAARSLRDVAELLLEDAQRRAVL